MEEDIDLDFNFWPSFADLMLALVLILMLVLFLASAVITIGTVNLSKVDENQKNMAKEIADAYKTQMKEIPDVKGLYGISIEKNGDKSGSYDILIQNEPTLQRITFSEQILFQPNDDQLNEKGVEALTIVGKALKKKLSFIREIQIQGHADPDPPARRFGDNLNLAALRAITVFKFFQDPNQTGIDPAANLMSITSFGEYKPVQRLTDDREYTQDKLKAHNGDKDLKAKNRRIELLLFYRLS